MSRKMKFDYVGGMGEMLSNIKVDRSDYEFLEKIAEKYFWRRFATTQRMCIKFAKENITQFESFIDKLINSDKDLL